MGHGADDGDVGVLLQGEGLVVVLEQDDALGVEVAGDLAVLLGVEVVKDLVVGDASIRVLKDARLELCAEDAGDGRVDDVLGQSAVGDELRDVLEAVASATHLDIVTGREGLPSGEQGIVVGSSRQLRTLRVMQASSVSPQTKKALERRAVPPASDWAC